MANCIIFSENNLFGLKKSDGEIILPCIHDEITQVGSVFYYRIWKDLGAYDEESENFWAQSAYRYWIKKNPILKFLGLIKFLVLLLLKVGSNKELELETGFDKCCTFNRNGLENVPLEEENGVLIKYEHGKFGVLTLDGCEILPCIFDYVTRWEDCDVIQTRTATTHRYFNLEGKEILTKRPCPPTIPIKAPYYLSYDPHYEPDEYDCESIVVVKQLVPELYDEQCCICYNRPCRFDRIPIKEFIKLSRNNCEHIQFNAEALEIFKYPEFNAYNANISISESIEQCIDEIEFWGNYYSDCGVIDKVFTNGRTIIPTSELSKLQRKAEEYPIDIYTLGYGIDETLEDGQIKVIHVKYYDDLETEVKEELNKM